MEKGSAYLKVTQFPCNGIPVPLNKDTPARNFSSALCTATDTAFLKTTKRHENDQTSFKWYMLAAKQENPEAMWNVGIYYEQGLSVATDVDTARMWYLRAANVGFPGAPYSLGRMSALGIATPKDEIEAYKWFLIGALLKEPYATAAFKSLGPTMTNADVKQGVERADEFGKAIEKRLEDRRAAELAAAEESERTTTPAASHGGTLEDKLRKLKKLEEAGLITKEEAAKKRGELLDNL